MRFMKDKWREDQITSIIQNNKNIKEAQLKIRGGTLKRLSNIIVSNPELTDVTIDLNRETNRLQDITSMIANCKKLSQITYTRTNDELCGTFIRNEHNQEPLDVTYTLTANEAPDVYKDCGNLEKVKVKITEWD